MEWFMKFTKWDNKPVMGSNRVKYPPLGEWTPKRRPIMCNSGWHVSDMEYICNWFGYDKRLYVCQAQGKEGKRDQWENSKRVFEQMRLLFEVSDSDANTLINRYTLKYARSLGWFTPKFFRLVKKYDHKARQAYLRAIADIDGEGVNGLCRLLAKNAKFRAYFERWVNRKLKTLGYTNGH